MVITRTRVFFVLAVSLAVFTSAAAAQTSIGAAQADFAAGNYRASLQKISQLLGGKLAPGGSKERYDLLMLRGECMLNLKNRDLAGEAFESASRVTFAKEDIRPTADAKAVAILIEHSPGLVFKPKGKSEGSGIDIVKPDSRKVAMAVLFDELLPVAREQAEAATTMTDVATVRKSLAPIADAYVIELATTGSAKQSLPLFKQVGGQARTFLAGEMERIQHRTEELHVLAAEPKDPAAESASAAERRGLTAEERKELEHAGSQVESLRQVSQEARRIARRLGSTGENWDTIIADGNELRDLIRQTLGAR